jgi:hypothetical protein
LNADNRDQGVWHDASDAGVNLELFEFQRITPPMPVQPRTPICIVPPGLF